MGGGPIGGPALVRTLAVVALLLLLPAARALDRSIAGDPPPRSAQTTTAPGDAATLDRAAGPAPPTPPPGAAGASDTAGTTDTAAAAAERDLVGASHQFMVAKILMAEGDYRAARQAFRRAVELDPEAAYVRLEYGEFLARLGPFGRGREERLELLRESVEQADTASRQLADGGQEARIDALRVKAQAYLALAEEEAGRPELLETALATLEELRREDPADVRSSFSLGQLYLRRQDFDAAADVLGEVVDRAPAYRPAYRLLAEALLGARRFDEAAEALRVILEEDPQNEGSRLALAEILAQRGRHQEAVEVLRASPVPLTLREARTRLAVELYLVGELEEALEEIEALLGEGAGAGEAVQEAGDGSYLQMLQGLTLSALARNDEALATLEPLLGRSPGDGNLAVSVSELLVREGRSGEAIETLRSALERQEAAGSRRDARQSRLALAAVYADLGRWSAVRELLEAWVASLLPEPGAAGEPAPLAGPGLRAALLQADALVELGRGEEALRLVDALMAALGRREPAAGEAGSQGLAILEAKRQEILVRLGRAEEADRALERAMGQVLAGDGSAQDLLQLIQGLHQAERYAPTVEPLTRLVESLEAGDGGSEAARPPGETTDLELGRYLLGTALERMDRREEAIETFRRLLERSPEFHPAMNYLGYLWIERGENLEEAIGWVRKALALDPNNSAYLDSLGWGYYQQGRYPEARVELERAARLERDPTIFEHLGDVYRALGETEQARLAYRRALELAELDGEDEEAVARKLDQLDQVEAQQE